MAQLADVTDEDSVARMIQMTETAFGGVDILVSNASVRGQVPTLEMSLEEWHRVLAVPLDGAFLLAKACIPLMTRRGGGRIIALGGVAPCIGTGSRVHLLAAKAGLIRGLATEFAPRGITCNIVSPGVIDTQRPLSAGPVPPMSTRPPIDRKGDPDEVAAMIHYLCLPEAAYVTGQTLHVNGGLYFGS